MIVSWSPPRISTRPGQTVVLVLVLVMVVVTVLMDGWDTAVQTALFKIYLLVVTIKRDGQRYVRA